MQLQQKFYRAMAKTLKVHVLYGDKEALSTVISRLAENDFLINYSGEYLYSSSPWDGSLRPTARTSKTACAPALRTGPTTACCPALMARRATARLASTPTVRSTPCARCTPTPATWTNSPGSSPSSAVSLHSTARTSSSMCSPRNSKCNP